MNFYILFHVELTHYDTVRRSLAKVITATVDPPLMATVMDRIGDGPELINGNLWVAVDGVTGIEWMLSVGGPVGFVNLKTKAVETRKPSFVAKRMVPDHLGSMTSSEVLVYVFTPGKHTPVPPMLLQGPGLSYTYRDPYGNYTAIPSDVTESILEANNIRVWKGGDELCVS